jgi:hypothetical protein
MPQHKEEGHSGGCLNCRYGCMYVGSACACSCHKEKADIITPTAVNLAFENGRKQGRKELQAELRGLLNVPFNELD